MRARSEQRSSRPVDGRSLPASADTVDALQRLREYTDRLKSQNLALRRKLFDLHTIFDITRQFNTAENVEPLLDGALATVIDQLGAGAAAIALRRDDEARDFDYVALQSWDGAHREDFVFPVEGSLAKMMSSVAGPIPAGDVLDRLGPRSKVRVRLRRLRCALMAPLIVRGRLRGVLFLEERPDRASFGEADLEYFSILLDQLGIAVQNVLLLASERAASRTVLLAQERLLKADKMAALGRVAAGVAHEVNNPLGIIKNYIRLIDRSLGDEADAAEHLGIIATEIDRIAGIVRQLSDAYRPDSAPPRPVDTARILTDTMRRFQEEMDKAKIDVTIECAGDLPEVWANEAALTQVVLNLAINARDAMKDLGGGLLTITAEPYADTVEIAFADTGAGLAEVDIERLFDPFFTTKTRGEGSGLGLSVCRGIVQRFGGTIEAVNGDPSGAVFTVRLPTQPAGPLPGGGANCDSTDT